ncbi:MAG: Rieske 2Fe-2S domain-containing protein [Nanoarchaeota archaeon]
MNPQHINDLKEPPVIHQFYIVPTVLDPDFGEVPVRGESHSDKYIIGEEREHFHFNIPFLPYTVLERLAQDIHTGSARIKYEDMPSLASVAIVSSSLPRGEKDFMCLREDPTYPHTNFTEALTEAYLGQKAQNNRCVHQGLDLSQVKLKNGCRECPLHGLCYNERDEVVRKLK